MQIMLQKQELYRTYRIRNDESVKTRESTLVSLTALGFNVGILALVPERLICRTDSLLFSVWFYVGKNDDRNHCI